MLLLVTSAGEFKKYKKKKKKEIHPSLIRYTWSGA